MPRFRFSIVPLSAAAMLTVSLAFAFGGNRLAAAENDGASNQKSAKPAPAEADPDDPFVVPEGTDPQTLQEFLNLIAQTPAQDRSRAGYRAHFSKLHDLGTEVFQRNVDDETSLLAISIITGSLEVLEQFGDQTAADRKVQFIESLKQNQRPALSTRGRLLDVQGQITGLDANDDAAIKAMIDRVAQLLQDKPLTLDHGRLAYGAISALEQIGDAKLVSAAAGTFAKPLRASDDPTLKGLADTLEGSARRMNLTGNPLQIEGPTVTGEKFNIDQWKGKVVIVDFWATWCGPCVAEMPALKKLYETHHAHGLEIVGISLDDSREQLATFIEQKQLPWPTIFIDPEGKEGWENPLATYYGVSAIPTVFLVGRDGKVISTDLFGEELAEAVEGLMKAN